MKMKSHSLYLCIVTFNILGLSTNYSLNSIDPKTFIELISQLPKGEIQEILNNKEVDSTQLDFSGLTLENHNWSGLSLRGAKFNNCKLIKINFTGCDLRETSFEGTTFDEVNFERCILWDGFKYVHSQLELVKFYSEMRNNEDRFKANKLDQLAQACSHKANILNNTLFSSQKIDLEGEDLSHLNLKGINLKNANLVGTKLIKTNLTDANLAGAQLIESNLNKANLTQAILENTDLAQAHLNKVRLSEDLELPSSGNESEIFSLWLNSEGETRKLYQKLVNARVGLFANIDNKVLKSLSWSEIDLRNVNFCNANLQGIDFTGQDLSFSDFSEANLTGCIFTNANLTNAEFEETTLEKVNFVGANLTNVFLWGTSLKYAQFTETLTIPNYIKGNELFELWVQAEKEKREKDSQILINHFEIFKNISNERFKNINLTNKNFSKASFYSTDFEGIDLTGCNFKNAYMGSICLENAILNNTDLRETNFAHTNLRGAEIGGAKLSDDFNLPSPCDDAELLHIYQSFNESKDPKAYKVLKSILIAKKILKPNNQASYPYHINRNVTFSSSVQIVQKFNPFFHNWVHAKGEELEKFEQQMQEEPDFFSNISNQQFLSVNLQRKSFVNAVLNGAPLQGVNLMDCDFTTTCLHGANLQKSILINSKFCLADLRSSNLAYADLRNSDLEGADLRGAILIGCSLAGAKLKDVKITDDFTIPGDLDNQQIIKHCYNFIDYVDDKTRRQINIIIEAMTQSDLSSSLLDLTKDNEKKPSSVPTLVNCISQQLGHIQKEIKKTEIKKEKEYKPLVLDGVVVTESNSKEQFSKINLVGKDLVKHNLTKYNLKKINLSLANFSESNLTEADLSESTLTRSIFYGSNLTKAHLEKIDAWGADFRLSNLHQANLTGADLCFADLEHTILIQAILENTHLRESNLKNVDLSYACLRGADLRNADLTGSDLTGADLTDALLMGANLSKVILSPTLTLPENCTDQDLYNLYFLPSALINIDNETQKILTLVVLAKNIIPKQNLSSLYNISTLVDLSLQDKKSYKELIFSDFENSGTVLKLWPYSDKNYQELRIAGINIFKDFSNDDFLKINLRKKNLLGAVLIDAPLQHVDLEGSCLVKANLEESNLSNANLKNTDLTGANLRGSNLTGACLDEAILIKSDLRGTRISNNFIIPKNFNDDKLFDLYHYFSDFIEIETRNSIRSILIAKRKIIEKDIVIPTIDLTENHIKRSSVFSIPPDCDAAKLLNFYNFFSAYLNLEAKIKLQQAISIRKIKKDHDLPSPKRTKLN